MLTYIAVTSSIIQVVVSYYIFKKGHSNQSYLIFLGLSLITLCWATLNFASVIYIESPLLVHIVRTIMFCVVVQVFLFYLFANAFPYDLLSLGSKGSIVYLLPVTLVAAITLSPYMFSSAEFNNGALDTKIGAGIAIFAVYSLFYIVSAFRILVSKFHIAVGLKRIQILLLLLAAVIMWIVIPVTNFVVTLIFKTTIFVKLAPTYSLVFASIISYALVKHRLFDSKTVLSSSTIYVKQYLKNNKNRAIEYYRLQTLVYESGSKHVSLDFSGVKNIDKSSITLLQTLKNYMKKQGRKIYFTKYTPKVFNQLRRVD